MVSEHPAYHEQLNKTLEERGLNKNMLYLILEEYTRWIEVTELESTDYPYITRKDLRSVVSEFVDTRPLTIDSILREK